MNEVLKAIADRYSCRDFTGKPLTEEQAMDLGKAALAAPSALNKMPWQIIVVTDKALIDELDADGMEISKTQYPDGYARMMQRGGKLFYNAPCLIIIAGDESSWSPVDCGIVSQNIALAAHSMGLGSVICGMARMPLNGPRSDEWRKRLQIPDGYKFGMSVCVGEAKSGKEPHELDMNKLTFVK